MAILKIIEEPDPRLRIPSQDVPLHSDHVGVWLDDMVQTMVHAKGIGLAAPQVGLNERMLVMQAGETLYKMINPQRVELSADKTQYEEGCLSVPGHYALVSRSARIRVRYFDETWTVHEKEFDGLESICLQHEMDHLDGVLFIDHLSWIKKAMIQKKRQKVRA